MQFVGSFTTFDQINGYFVVPNDKLLQLTDAANKYSDEQPLILDWMARRAREILAQRSSQEITEILNAINWLLATAYDDESGMDDEPDGLSLREFVKRELHIDLGIGFYTPARVLNSISPVIDVDGVDQFANATWEECFAVVSLATLGEIHRVLAKNGTLSASIVALAAEAMEALALAETPLRLSSELNRPLRVQISLRNQKSAIKGHADRNAWKDGFLNWVENEHLPSLQGKRLNRRAAAKLFTAMNIAVPLRQGKLPEWEGRQAERILADSLTNHPRFKDS